MLNVVPRQEESGYEFDLRDMQKKLERTKYFGSITIVWQDGRIVLIREERTLKPGSFDRFI